jgi:NADPH:quinone reductase-like Zn-dependent oxidoreductase
MRAVSLNYRDTVVIRLGGYVPAPPQTAPFIPLSDGAGVVESVGRGCTHFAVGDRVCSVFFPNWHAGPPALEKRRGALGLPGAAAVGGELMLFDEDALTGYPDFLNEREAATLPCAALTAWRAMFVDVSLKPGDTVILQGTGGVALFGLQFAVAAGLRTIVTSSSDAKLARCKDLGAAHLINYRATPDWAQEVLRITDGQGAQFIMELGGRGTLAQSLDAIAMGGHVAIVGVLADTDAAAPPFSASTMIAKSARLQGVSVGSREMFAGMCKALSHHQLSPVIGATYPWTEAAVALRSMLAGEHFGKLVLEFP